MSKRLFNNETELTIASAYADGATITKLATAYGTSKTVVSNLLKRHGVKTRQPKESLRLSVNDYAFDKLTNDVAYWIGMLLTDGCIIKRKNRTPVISLALATVDSDHIEKFQNFVKAEHRIYRARKYTRLQFSSQPMTSTLAAYGIVPRKTGEERVPAELAFNRHFWRGVIDGDGTITHIEGQYPTIGVCGSKSVCDGFLAFARTIIPTLATARKIKGANCWQTHVHGHGSKTLCKVLYSNCTTSLNRKLLLAKAIMC